MRTIFSFALLLMFSVTGFSQKTLTLPFTAKPGVVEIPFGENDPIPHGAPVQGSHTGFKSKTVTCGGIQFGVIYAWNEGGGASLPMGTRIDSVCSKEKVKSYQECRAEDSPEIRACFDELKKPKQRISQPIKSGVGRS